MREKTKAFFVHFVLFYFFFQNEFIFIYSSWIDDMNNNEWITIEKFQEKQNKWNFPNKNKVKYSIKQYGMDSIETPTKIYIGGKCDKKWSIHDVL